MAIPVAPVVVWVVVNNVFTHVVDINPTETVLFGVTLMIPVAFNAPQPPANGIL